LPSGCTHYYYDKGGKPRREIPLGSDYALAVKKWAEIEIDARPRHVEIATFRYVAERYQREVLPTKAPRTQRDNLKELSNLLAFFDDPPAPIEQITPQHVAQYMKWRKDAPVRANREKALCSHQHTGAKEAGQSRASKHTVATGASLDPPGPDGVTSASVSRYIRFGEGDVLRRASPVTDVVILQRRLPRTDEVIQ
jgi:hypothetical protein